MGRIGLKERVLLVSLFLNVGRKGVVTLPELPDGMRTESSLLARPVSARPQPLVERSHRAGRDCLVDLTIDLVDEVRPASTGRKIVLHFPIPSFFFQLFKPVEKLFSLRLRKVADLVFERFNRHTYTIARV